MPWHCFVVSVVVCFFVLQYFFVWYLKQRIKIPDTCRNDMSGLSLSYKDATCSKTWARSSPFSSTRSTMFLYGKLFTIWPYVIAPEKKWSFKDCNSYRRGNNFVRSTPLKGTLWKASEEREIEKQARWPRVSDKRWRRWDANDILCSYALFVGDQISLKLCPRSLPIVMIVTVWTDIFRML